MGYLKAIYEPVIINRPEDLAWDYSSPIQLAQRLKILAHERAVWLTVTDHTLGSSHRLENCKTLIGLDEIYTAEL